MVAIVSVAAPRFPGAVEQSIPEQDPHPRQSVGPSPIEIAADLDDPERKMEIDGGRVKVNVDAEAHHRRVGILPPNGQLPWPQAVVDHEPNAVC